MLEGKLAIARELMYAPIAATPVAQGLPEKLTVPAPDKHARLLAGKESTLIRPQGRSPARQGGRPGYNGVTQRTETQCPGLQACSKKLNKTEKTIVYSLFLMLYKVVSQADKNKGTLALNRLKDIQFLVVII